MSTLAEHMIVAGAKNRPLMLDMVTVQQVQGRQDQSSAYARTKGNATRSRGNNTAGQERVVKCYNYQREGHMASAHAMKPQVFYDDTHKQALGYQNSFYLKKAQQIKPTLYDGIVISKKHDVISMVDEEETLILEEESRSKMLAKQNDPTLKEKKINIALINYFELNKLSEDFGKYFVPQMQLSIEQAFWLSLSNPESEQLNVTQKLVEIEVPKELLKNIAFQTDDLDAYDFDCDDISSAKAVLMANLSSYNSDVLFEETKTINESLTIELERYKDRVKKFEQRLNVDLSSHEKFIDSQMDDMLQNRNAFKQENDSLKQTHFKQVKENDAHAMKPQVFYDDTHKQALGYQNSFYLKKAQQIKPTLYDGIVISKKHDVISMVDEEETLILEEESRSKMLAKQNDPTLKEKKINIALINYFELNKLSEDFGKYFVPQMQLSIEQAFWLSLSNPESEQLNVTQKLVEIEVPKELLKVSLVNTSFQKLRNLIAIFNKVVKVRTTLVVITEGS
nr:hypothetical protein [Tanacetum cinerariifolium]